MARRHSLTDDQWELIADIFGKPARTGRPPVDRRTVVDGIFWILRTGAPWRDLPEHYGKWKTIHDLFRRWSHDGTIDKIFRRLRDAMVDVQEIDTDLWCVDGTHVRAARCAAGAPKKSGNENASNEALGRSRGGFSTKIHILCDGKGNPLAAVLSPGQHHESRYLDELLDAEVVGGEDGQLPLVPVRLAGDKSYRADWIDEFLLNREIIPVIPSKANEASGARLVPFDEELYKRRGIVEQLVGWVKECRRVATRYEKRARHYLSMVLLSMIGRYLRKICPAGSRV